MILPHLEPVRFAKEITSCDKNVAFVKCKFPSDASLAMLCEAAAQSSAAFAQNNFTKEGAKIGFLVSLKNVNLLKDLNDNKCDIKVTKNVDLGNMCEYDFEVINKGEIFSNGTFTIVIQA